MCSAGWSLTDAQLLSFIWWFDIEVWYPNDFTSVRNRWSEVRGPLKSECTMAILFYFCISLSKNAIQACFISAWGRSILSCTPVRIWWAVQIDHRSATSTYSEDVCYHRVYRHHTVIILCYLPYYGDGILLTYVFEILISHLNLNTDTCSYLICTLSFTPTSSWTAGNTWTVTWTCDLLYFLVYKTMVSTAKWRSSYW